MTALDTALLARARHLRQQSGRTLVEELEALTGMEPRALVRALAQPFGMAVLETVDMLACAGVDLLPLSQAMARHCVLLRGADGVLAGVIADPFDLDLQTWRHGARRRRRRCRRGSRCRPTSRPTCRSRRNRRAPPIAAARRQRRAARRQDGGRAVVCLGVGSASPAVRLVNSTLYDALKAGASDIHLESTAGGLAVKYRVDGVLDHATAVNGIEWPSRSSRA
jgi:general secretion pathway protein E